MKILYLFLYLKLSNTNKKQLDSLRINWVELRDIDGCRRFKKCLEDLKIPHKDFGKLTDEKVENAFKKIFK